MALLSKVQKGQPITAELFNNMIDAIRECQLNAVVGSGGTVATFKRGAGGTTISIASRSQQQTGGGASELCPFTPIITATSSGYNVTFSAGMINGILPTNMFNNFSVTTANTNYFYLNCNSDGKLVTNAEIRKQITIPVPSESSIDTAPSEFKVLFAVVTTSAEGVRTIPCNNLSASVVPTIQEDNPDYVIGGRNFKQYYNWSF